MEMQSVLGLSAFSTENDTGDGKDNDNDADVVTRQSAFVTRQLVTRLSSLVREQQHW